MNLDKDKILAGIRKRSKLPHDWPSEAHEVAWSIADYLNEPYAFWVRKITKRKRLLLGQVRYEFQNMKGKSKLSKRSIAKILLKELGWTKTK